MLGAALITSRMKSLSRSMPPDTAGYAKKGQYHTSPFKTIINRTHEVVENDRKFRFLGHFDEELLERFFVLSAKCASIIAGWDDHDKVCTSMSRFLSKLYGLSSACSSDASDHWHVCQSILIKSRPTCSDQLTPLIVCQMNRFAHRTGNYRDCACGCNELDMLAERDQVEFLFFVKECRERRVDSFRQQAP
jgi:hypothetical protein